MRKEALLISPNSRGLKVLRKLNKWLGPKQKKVRTILSGPLRGLQMWIEPIQQPQLWLGLSERETYSWMRRLCKGINTAIDVGAAFGEQTLYFIKRSAAKKVYTFDPRLNAFEELKQNIAMNGLEPEKELHLSTKMIGSENTSEMCTLDSFYDGIVFPCMIKMDIEGAEINALKGAGRLLGAQASRWLIEVHSIECENACLEILDCAGYQVRIIKNRWWRLFVPEGRGESEHNRWLAAYRANDLSEL
jgi:methyltransferase FkbM-like protein